MAVFNSTNSNDTFHGDSSNDRVVFSGNAAGYRIEIVNGFMQIVDIDSSDGDTGADTLTGIETLDFIDRNFSLAGALAGSLPGETRINTHTTSHQQAPAITALADGGYVITWQSFVQDGDSYGIYAQRFDANGHAVGGETRVHTTTANGQTVPAITALADQGYVITWMADDGQDGDGFGIYAQRFDADGDAVGTETRINTRTTDWQLDPAITALADGGYIIAWHSDIQDGSGYGIYAQRFDAGGDAVGSETLINTHTINEQFGAAVAALADGGYVISWSSNEQDTWGAGVYAQRFAANGDAVGSETQISTYTIGDQASSAIAALADGGYVITWHSDIQDESGYGIYAKRFDASGNLVGGETRINTHTASHQNNPAITALADGGYVIVWQSTAQDGAGGSGIYAQRFDASANAIGSETRINTYTTSWQSDPAITSLADGGYVITWNSYGQDGSEYGIYAQRFDAGGLPVASGLEISGTADADTLTGGAGIQTLIGLAGNDTLVGGSGKDSLIGGDGDDIYVLSDFDTLVELAGGGIDTVQAGFTYTLGNQIENLTLTGAFAANGTGNTLNNVIMGNTANNTLNGLAGDDTLDGAGGNDRMFGGNGNDIYHLRNAGDVLTESSGTGGADTVHSYLSAYTLGANIEHAVISITTAANLTGNALDNNLTGNTGNNILDAGDGDDSLQGDGGNDRLQGGDGNDMLSGGTGNDTLIGGRGNDTLNGSNGADKFQFSSSITTNRNVDTVTNFVSGDAIHLENSVFGSLVATGALNAANFRASTSGNAVDADDFILYNTDNGRLFYDADGNGVGGKIQFALVGVTIHPVLTAADFVVI